MQELIDDIGKYIKVDWPMNKSIRNSINKGLEKEKEQIIEAHKIGWEDCQEYIKTIGQTTRKGKKYYNQTYNQNK